MDYAAPGQHEVGVLHEQSVAEALAQALGLDDEVAQPGTRGNPNLASLVAFLRRLLLGEQLLVVVDPSLSFRYACRVSMCGSCAMVINGKERLACKTVVGDLKEKKITIRPLNHFPIIKDLVVDMDPFFEKYKEAMPYFDPKEDTEEPVNGMQPVIIAEMTADIKSLTVGEAVMQMELTHAPFLMFKNDANRRINIVFQRDDGNVGWIDPANLSES